MALRSVKAPTSIPPGLIVSSSIINKPHSLRFASKPTASLAVRSNLIKLKPASPRAAKFRCSASSSSALTPQLRDTLEKLVNSEKVVLFMKGTRDFPMCGFSNTVGLKEYSSWPTFPQLYIGGEFFGGCDITLEAFQSGELQEAVERAMCS
ncbi:hypothetical protein F2Q68_00041535 [Brassica cretica]|uniref:Glutaredoxin domain-containing protein n=2 Tax=Brassica cretica TaxID=69181 RepID=A0ABQ7AHZ0_BRACR|nr:hypothetical protein F2Q68_00041535 [Brassica cretica]KAF3497502.1 hypothetical protein DY000_02056209 [Brassica cretica]